MILSADSEILASVLTEAKIRLEKIKIFAEDLLKDEADVLSRETANLLSRESTERLIVHGVAGVTGEAEAGAAKVDENGDAIAIGSETEAKLEISASAIDSDEVADGIPAINPQVPPSIAVIGRRMSQNDMALITKVRNARTDVKEVSPEEQKAILHTQALCLPEEG